jgi:hypothetical protein
MEFVLHVSMNKHTLGLAFFPFILINKRVVKHEKLYQRVLNHERIHLAQQKELLLVFFVIWYYAEYMYHYIRTLHTHKAYKKIRFEKECFDNEADNKYLNHRVPYSYIKREHYKKR